VRYVFHSSDFMWQCPECVFSCVSDGLIWPTTLRLERIELLCASEADCTSETGVGQFSIFGAVEEKLAANFPRLKLMKCRPRGALLGALDGGSFVPTELHP
jgi:hypothetical protein